MTGISGSNASGNTSPLLQGQRLDQKARIQFENALAAERTVVAKPATIKEEIPESAQIPSSGVTQNALWEHRAQPTRRIVPVQKVLQSLNKLIQNNRLDSQSSFDVRQ